MSQVESSVSENEQLVPGEVIPHETLPPLRYRDMPPAISWKKMLGPSILLAGLALGSGEFVLWPHITYKAGFVFFWACLLGVTTQFFLNMEIERYTLATGESTVTGFCRLSRHWAWVFLLANVVTLVWPAWASGAGTLFSWLVYGAEQNVSETGAITFSARNGHYFGVAGLVLVGVVLTSGPVVYNTVEKIQTFLVGSIMFLTVVLAVMLVKPYAIAAFLSGSISIGTMPPESSGLTFAVLLGALAFAGVGGTLNLGQSNYIKDKGYGMGKYIGRITSPITGQEEAVSEAGYFFPQDEANISRWKQWWKAANIEHFLSFFVTCVVSLALLSLISYSIFYGADGSLKPGMENFGDGLNFIWGEATEIGNVSGGMMKTAFLLMGIALMLTTELGILDVFARLSADIVKVNWLRNNERWSLSRLYFLFLWSEILVGVVILLTPDLSKPLLLLVITASMQGGVMFVYSILLLWLNKKVLPRAVGMSPVRFIAILWSAVFFGYFTLQMFRIEIIPAIQKMLE